MAGKNARPQAGPEHRALHGVYDTHPGESQNSLIVVTPFLYFAHRRRVSVQSMRTASPVVFPYEPPRLLTRGTSTNTPGGPRCQVIHPQVIHAQVTRKLGINGLRAHVPVAASAPGDARGRRGFH